MWKRLRKRRRVLLQDSLIKWIKSLRESPRVSRAVAAIAISLAIRRNAQVNS